MQKINSNTCAHLFAARGTNELCCFQTERAISRSCRVFPAASCQYTALSCTLAKIPSTPVSLLSLLLKVVFNHLRSTSTMQWFSNVVQHSCSSFCAGSTQFCPRPVLFPLPLFMTTALLLLPTKVCVRNSPTLACRSLSAVN